MSWALFEALLCFNLVNSDNSMMQLLFLLRHKEMKSLALGHSSSQWQNLGTLDLEFIPLHFTLHIILVDSLVTLHTPFHRGSSSFKFPKDLLRSRGQEVEKLRYYAKFLYSKARFCLLPQAAFCRRARLDCLRPVLVIITLMEIHLMACVWEHLWWMYQSTTSDRLRGSTFIACSFSLAGYLLPALKSLKEYFCIRNEPFQTSMSSFLV